MFLSLVMGHLFQIPVIPVCVKMFSPSFCTDLPISVVHYKIIILVPFVPFLLNCSLFHLARIR